MGITSSSSIPLTTVVIVVEKMPSAVGQWRSCCSEWEGYQFTLNGSFLALKLKSIYGSADLKGG